jgi:hypothetical protein
MKLQASFFWVKIGLCALLLLDSIFIQSQPPIEESFIYFDNSSIHHNNRWQKTFDIQSGDMRVFVFNSNNAGDPGNHSVADSKLVFQIPMKRDEFHFTGEKLAETNAVYIQFCLCQDEGIQKVVDGYIKGRKIDENSWDVEFELIANGRKTKHEYTFRESEVFKLIEE